MSTTQDSSVLSQTRRLRFSLRTLIFVVTAIALVLGCWEATVTWGTQDVKRFVQLQEESRSWVLPDGRMATWGVGVDAYAEAMFLIRTHVAVGERSETRYYLWFFGLKRHVGSWDESYFVPDSAYFIQPEVAEQ